MKITIYVSQKEKIELTNESLNNDNFVDIFWGGDEPVPLDELKAAVDAFYQLRKQRKENDLLYRG